MHIQINLTKEVAQTIQMVINPPAAMRLTGCSVALAAVSRCSLISSGGDKPHDQRDSEWHDDDVIQVARHGNEIGDQVDGDLAPTSRTPG